MSQLDQLIQHRDAILLAEAIGWLHDYWKCSEEQLQKQSPINDKDLKLKPKEIALQEITKRFSSLGNTLLEISTAKESLSDLLNQWHGKAGNAGASFLLQYLSRCHNTAHFDKQDPLKSGRQNYPDTQISSAFGFETAVGSCLSAQLWALPWDSLITNHDHERSTLRQAVQSLFSNVGADTRRPINEISLWDWGLLVGALYKTALAAVALGQSPVTHDLRWRLLGIRTDALAYFSNVPDLVARQNTLQTAINNVQTLLETVYPVATEVYRDENGSLYVVPDMANLLGLQDSSDKTLLSLIKEQFACDGEIVPDITLDPNPWWGQDPVRAGNDEIPPAGSILSSPVTWKSDADAVREAWKEQRQTVCPICGLRSCVNRQLDYCQICGDRRKGRVKEWLQEQNKTIWIDEVADRNGRLALITGTFNLTNWLDGSLVETMLVKEPTDSNPSVPKIPSFARLRRIWQTTRTFWKQSQSDIDQHLTDARRRLTIRLANSPKLTPNQTYELDLGGQTRMSVLWDGNHLLSIDNLSYTASQLGFPLNNFETKENWTPEDLALDVCAWVKQHKESWSGQKQVFQLFSDEEKNKQFDIQIGDMGYQDAAYASTIPILAEPRTFMVLVPADCALDLIHAIKTKYEREIGKVRNRLSLHLGAVYFHRRTPLRAALDAGRRMLKYDLGQMKDEVWIVKEDAKRELLPLEKQYLAEEENKQLAEAVAVKLEQNGRFLTWYVPARMGDGKTDDSWYPYVFIQNDVSKRKHIFKALRPKSDHTTEECWLIHATKLQAGDRVYFTPATFDFQWLGSSGERFEIAYENGKRRNQPMRPYLLDELTTIQQAWKVIAGKGGLTANQIYALRDLIEIKRENWQPSANHWVQDCYSQTGMFWLFCRDVINNANWKNKPVDEEINLLINWAVSGLLADVIHLHMGVMKQKPQREENNE